MFSKQKTNGRVDLKAIHGATPLKERPSNEFEMNGTGGQDLQCRHGYHVDEFCPHCNKDDEVKISLDDLRERLPRLAVLAGTLTYGEMVQFSHEVLKGTPLDSLTFDVMEASPEAHRLAAQVYKWSALRQHT